MNNQPASPKPSEQACGLADEMIPTTLGALVIGGGVERALHPSGFTLVVLAAAVGMAGVIIHRRRIVQAVADLKPSAHRVYEVGYTWSHRGGPNRRIRVCLGAIGVAAVLAGSTLMGVYGVAGRGWHGEKPAAQAAHAVR